VDSTITDTARLLSLNLIERRDAVAIQGASGAYSPALDGAKQRRAMTRDDVLAHVQGQATIGHYVVSAENTCRMFLFDIDLRAEHRDEWLNGGPNKADLSQQLRAISDGLARKIVDLYGIKVLVAYSGNKGVHVIGVLEPGTPAGDARTLCRGVLESYGPTFELEKGKNFWRHTCAYPALTIETFPKQAEVREDDGLGNLVRLPLGVNRKSGRAGFFMDMSQPIERVAKDDPLLALKYGSIR
jgi:hypothetical protein